MVTLFGSPERVSAMMLVDFRWSLFAATTIWPVVGSDSLESRSPSA